jgi:hypothetical protein
MIRYTAFLIGLGLLILGSYVTPQPDWDIPISIIMATLTFLTAERTLSILLNKQWKLFPLAIFYVWISTDGSYWLYWSIANPDALVLRWVAFQVDILLYVSCMIVFSEARLLDEKYFKST